MSSDAQIPEFQIFTWGSCRFGEVEILYPKYVKLSKVTYRRGKHVLDLGAVVIEYENADSRKNMHRNVRIVGVREPIVVKYYGNESCSRSFLEVWVIDKDGARKAELKSKIVEEENGKYRYRVAVMYVEYNGQELVVDKQILEKQPIMEKMQIKARVDGNKIIVSGDTYHVRDVLKALKFRWDWVNKVWYVECSDDSDVGYTLMELEAQLKERGVSLVIEQ